MSPQETPYWRLSGFYFFYYAVVGTIVPYLALYLQSLGFSAVEIGQIAAITMVTRVIAPNIWGWLSDRSGRRLATIRLGSLLACLCFAAMLWERSFWGIAFIVIGYSFFWNAVLGQFEVITLSYLEGRSHFYSRIRVWGSVGFIAAVMALGYFFDHFDIGWLPALVLAFLIIIWLSSLTLSERPWQPTETTPGDGFLPRLLQPAVLCFMGAAFLLQVSHGAYYTFFSVYLEGLGYSRGAIGALWGLAVVAEVFIFLFMHRFMKRFSPRDILLVTLMLTVLRWWLTGCFPDQLPVVLFAQLLHAFSFGSAHAVAIELVRRYFYGRPQGQGQAFYSAISWGAGGAVGALISGWIWDASPVGAFAFSALAAALALALVWGGMRGEEETRSC